VDKIKVCKQKLSELKKYENIIKKKHVKKFIFVNADHFVNVLEKELLQPKYSYL
jgi:hypothetical protein